MRGERQTARGAKESVPGDTREHLLEAAAEVVVALGANGLTLEAVAKRAGVSKGGLLYHFPSKRALLQAMILWHIGVTEAAADAAVSASGAEGIDGKLLGSLAIAARDDARADEVGSALFAAIANDLELLTPIREKLREHIDALKGARVGFERAVIVELAIQGLQFFEMLRLEPFDKDERRRVIAALEHLASGGEP